MRRNPVSSAMETLKQLLRWLVHLLGLGPDRERLEWFAGLAQKIEPRASFEVLALPESEKLILKEISRRARDSRSEGGSGTIVLFSGTSSGKADAAEAVAKDLQQDLYRVDSSRVVSKYIGETEKHLSRLFKGAASAGAILFFDEADALFGKRSEIEDSHDRYTNSETNYLLQLFERSKGLAILAANVEETAPPEFLRRFHFVVNFHQPSRS